MYFHGDVVGYGVVYVCYGVAKECYVVGSFDARGCVLEYDGQAVEQGVGWAGGCGGRGGQDVVGGGGRGSRGRCGLGQMSERLWKNHKSRNKNKNQSGHLDEDQEGEGWIIHHVEEGGRIVRAGRGEGS